MQAIKFLLGLTLVNAIVAAHPVAFSQTYTWSTIAGTPGLTGTNDGQGSVTLFNTPSGITVDISGNLYVADTGNGSVRRLVQSGTNWTVSTISANNGNAESPFGIVADSSSSPVLFLTAVFGGGLVTD